MRADGLIPDAGGSHGGLAVAPSLEIVERELPPTLVVRIPIADRWWRGRTILLLWILGYPLREAWAFGMSEDPEQVAFYRDSMAELEDERLSVDLAATSVGRRQRSAWP